jgi:flagellar basal-body rod protein FlgF
MSDLLSVVVSALRADQSKLEQSSLNAANAATPGYRRATIASLAFDQVLSAQKAVVAGANAGQAWVPTSAVIRKVVDFTPGALQQTGRPLDVAIEGEGFLPLTDGSRTWLTRTASLQVDVHGDLVGPKGLRLLGATGDIHPGNDKDLSINASGQIMRGEQVLGRIKLMTPTNEALMASEDGVHFEVSSDHLQDAQADQGAIRAGFLEGSNTSSLKEMLGVMESVRHFESLIRLAQGYDEVLGKAIQKLGEV